MQKVLIDKKYSAHNNVYIKYLISIVVISKKGD